MAKELRIMFDPSGKIDEGWLKNCALQINNEMSIPMKILDIVQTPHNGGYNATVRVEDCLDEKEWDKLVRVFFIGYNARDEEIQKK